MDNVLHDLYHGGIFPAEHIVSRDPEYRPVNRKISDEKRYFESKMSLDDCRRFEALGNLYAQSSCMQEEASFYYGFKLGAALMLAVHTESQATKNE